MPFGVTIYPSVSKPFDVTAGPGVTQDGGVTAQNSENTLLLMTSGHFLLMSGGDLLLV